MNAAPDRALAALLAEDGEAPSATEHPLPMLNERVDLFLRAVHGDRAFTTGERVDARDRILDAMASPGFEGQQEWIKAANYDKSAYNERGAANIPAKPGPSNFSQSFRDLGQSIRDALLLPLTLQANGAMRFAIVSCLALLVVGAGWSGAWFYTARTAETAIASWIDGEAKAGRVYGCGSKTVEGFPFRVEMSCIDPKATLALGNTILTIDAKELRAVVRLAQPSVLTAEMSGPLSIADKAQPATFISNWTLARITLQGAPDAPERLVVAFDGAQFYRATQTSMEPLLTSERLELDAQRSESTGRSAIDLAIRVAGGTMPLVSAIPPEPISAEIGAVLHNIAGLQSKDLAAFLAGWQAAGGNLEVTQAQIRQGQAVATAQGQIGLTGSGQVDGSLRVATAGAYAQIAQSVIQDGQRAMAEREKIAQAAPARQQPQVRALSRSLPPAPPPAIVNSQMPDPKRRIEAIEREAARQRTLRDNPASPSTIPQGGEANLPIRFIDGTVYVGPTLVGEIPRLF